MIELLDAARCELANDRPEQFKILLLATMAGLRRNEIDTLPWNAFRFNENVFRIEATEHYRPKSHNSEGDVIVDAELMELFRGYFARRKSDFVIESEFEPVAHDEPYGTYRCRQHMRALLDWLRNKGVASRSPLHALRKEFGSQIHAQHGLLAASEQLRHANIQTSARHYLESRQRATVGLGHVLKRDRTIVPMRNSASF
jgi:integrase